MFSRGTIRWSMVVILACASALAEETWTPLFDGKTLDGWTQRGGTAPYRVEGDTIVGTTVPGKEVLDKMVSGTGNSFLCTDKNYGDFILELEFKVDPQMNSGVQIRSNSIPEYKNGQVHGYQVEIDPSDRAWTAGIYDEGRRGWLYNLEGPEREAARKAFKQNEWNHVRVEARGDSIKTWLNGVPAADLKDSMTPTGFIALQVHASKDPEPREVRWRNIRIQSLDQAAPAP
ncbi:MAG: hypothetical protein QG656_460 [Candidatus Hydrogenedentes bacterium]|nr:hypothetical protein [Candidatus Hydrogenedentota bacterium]